MAVQLQCPDRPGVASASFGCPVRRADKRRRHPPLPPARRTAAADGVGAPKPIPRHLCRGTKARGTLGSALLLVLLPQVQPDKGRRAVAQDAQRKRMVRAVSAARMARTASAGEVTAWVPTPMITSPCCSPAWSAGEPGCTSLTTAPLAPSGRLSWSRMSGVSAASPRPSFPCGPAAAAAAEAGGLLAWKFAHLDFHGLRLAVAHDLQPGGLARLHPRDVAARDRAGCHRLAVHRPDHVAGLQARRAGPGRPAAHRASSAPPWSARCNACAVAGDLLRLDPDIAARHMAVLLELRRRRCGSCPTESRIRCRPSRRRATGSRCSCRSPCRPG